MTWKQLTERDCREWKLSVIYPHDRDTWRAGVRFAICVQQAICLEGGPLLWIWPLYLHVNQKSDDDNDDVNGVSYGGWILKEEEFEGTNFVKIL